MVVVVVVVVVVAMVGARKINHVCMPKLHKDVGLSCVKPSFQRKARSSIFDKLFSCIRDPSIIDTVAY